MQTDPVAEWKRLSEHYRELSDTELHTLNRQREDLTEVAGRVLDADMSSRKLTARPVHEAEKHAPSEQAAERSRTIREAVLNHPADDEEELADDELHDYTWKTELCECDSADEAWQLSQALKQAGIDNWLTGPGFDRSDRSLDTIGPRVMVAADQLEEAIEVAKRPIPQEIVELAGIEVPEYETLVCPACGAEDPVLESTEPTNRWLCEVCGRQWSEPEEAAEEKP